MIKNDSKPGLDPENTMAPLQSTIGAGNLAANEESAKDVVKVEIDDQELTMQVVAAPSENSTTLESTPIVRPALIDRVENYLHLVGKYRFNIVLGRVEYCPIFKNEYKLMIDYDLHTLLRKLKKERIDAQATMLRQILHSEFSVKYDPIQEYFNGLPVWDKQTDYIQKLAETVKTTEDALWYACFKKWIVAVVACAINEQDVNHTVLLFSGKQGIGKTTWLLNLVPKQLKDYCYSGDINTDNKDSAIMLSECFLINIDELEVNMSKIKDYITKKVIRIRRPYGYNAENLIRRASIMGSVNHLDFLTDSTGSRRFLCFEALSIDYQHGVSIDQVYSQAYTLMKEGFQFWFSGAEIDALNRNNEKYRLMSVEEELLLASFELCKREEATHYLATTEILKILAEDSRISVNQTGIQRLGRALRARKFLRIKRGSIYIYALKKKDAEIVGLQQRFSAQGDELIAS